ncbi:hypothetical protein DFJ74DRAFT_666608 [Hyaloraphidium curvatum]|nr:hypothetical protein DFJ74DRAFT_666608 [Hyaloraphidium curvatum]
MRYFSLALSAILAFSIPVSGGGSPTLSSGVIDAASPSTMHSRPPAPSVLNSGPVLASAAGHAQGYGTVSDGSPVSWIAEAKKAATSRTLVRWSVAEVPKPCRRASGWASSQSTAERKDSRS